MGWGFTSEWLAERERKKKLQALGSVAPVKAPTIHGNCELVTLEKRQQAREWNGQPTYTIVEQCRWARIAEPVSEFKFHPHRKWRADFCWPKAKVILECNGGVWTQGRHTRGKGAIADMEKASEAAILGYRVLYCTPEEMENGVALDRVVRALTDA